jgi:tetratricopeptide (TPR) repeat protein
MSHNPRIDELKRRVQQDPASIAFAALADEYRRAGMFHDAVETCRAGLQRHPAYVSARVTLGRSLVELGEFEEAREHLEQVLRSAPENLAAIRALADIHRRNGEPLESAIQSAVEASSAAQTAAEPKPSSAPALKAAPAIPAIQVAPVAETRGPSPVPVTPAPVPLKTVAVHADSHPSIALVTRASEPDVEELEIADLATMADTHLPVIQELEQLLAGIERARQAIDALGA